MMRLPPLPTTAELIKLYGLSAKQELSQNFLLDLNVTDKIARASGSLKGKAVLEVGPGPGPLSRSILRMNPKVLSVVEKDRRFIPALETIQAAVAPGVVRIHRGDILKVSEAEILQSAGAEKCDWESPTNSNLIVGNLPFGVATELLIKWIHCIPTRSGPFHFGRVPMLLMFQKEVAMRITARPKTKEYGRLSVMVQNSCDARCLFDIDGAAFVPPPKVKATVVLIEPRIKPHSEVHLDSLEYVCRQVFGQRRKMLANSIHTISPEAHELLEMAKLDERKRPEDLTISEWCALANAYHNWPKRSADAILPFTTELQRLHDQSRKATSSSL
jgi:dimethyladenosine transferase 1